jgi:hypothetical protein
MTDVARTSEDDWAAWASTLILAALGIFAVQAGNALTLLIAWTAFDLADALILIGHITKSTGRERVVVAFTTRLAGSFLLLWAWVYGRSSGIELDFNAIPSRLSLLLLIAGILRLGVVPIHQPFLREDRYRRNLRTMSRLSTCAAAFVLLTRTAAAGSLVSLHTLILWIAGLGGIYAVYAWASARDEIEGRPYWILGASTFVVAAAVRGQPGAALAWGLAAILCGGLLFLLSERHRFLIVLTALTLFALSGLPYSLTWSGASLYTAQFELVLPLLIITQAGLMIGVFRHTARRAPLLSRAERWVWVIYPWGMAILVIAQIILSWYQRFPAITIANTLPGIITTALLAGWYFFQRKYEAGPVLARIGERATPVTSSLFSLNWLYRILWAGYNAAGGMISFFTEIVEGEGGVLWSMLFLVLMVVILIQVGMGL